MTKKYGVMLLYYRSTAHPQGAWQEFNMWVYDHKGRFETTDLDKAQQVREEYQDRNPGGVYEIKLIEE